MRMLQLHALAKTLRPPFGPEMKGFRAFTWNMIHAIINPSKPLVSASNKWLFSVHLEDDSLTYLPSVFLQFIGYKVFMF